MIPAAAHGKALPAWYPPWLKLFLVLPELCFNMKVLFQGDRPSPGGYVSLLLQRIVGIYQRKLLLFVSALLVAQLLSAQRTSWPRINLSRQSGKVNDLLSALELQINSNDLILFEFFKAHIDDSLLNKKITYRARNEHLDHFLDRTLKKIGIGWYKRERSIILYPDPGETSNRCRTSFQAIRLSRYSLGVWEVNSLKVKMK